MRTIGQHIGRGLQNAAANWPLTLLTFVVRFIMGVMIVIAFVIAIVPIVIAGVVSTSDLGDMTLEAFMERFILGSPLLVTGVILIFAVVTLPVMIVHAFHESGKARVVLDADRAAGSSLERVAYSRFDVQRWWRAGVEQWWPVFLILNIVWSIALSLMLVPLAVVAALLVRSVYTEGGFGIPCGAALAMLPIVLGLSIIAHSWSELATLHHMSTGRGAVECSRAAARLLRSHPQQVLGTGFLMFLITIAAVITVILLQMGVGMMSSLPGIALMLVPLQVLVSIGQSVVTAFLSAWTTAAFASLYVSTSPIITEGSIRSHERTAVPES